MKPNLDPAARLYQGASGHAYRNVKRQLRPETLKWVMALRAEKFQRHIAASDVVFELGVGSGWNLGSLRCARRIGCDTAELLADRLAALDIEFVNDITAVPTGVADIAICHHTLEHLLEPAGALKEIARVLKPGRKLILHVPWEREWQYAHYRPDEPNHHLFHWNAQNLGNLAVATGYRIESVRTCRYGYDRFAANLGLRLRLGKGGFRAIRAALISLRPLREVELIATT